MRKPTKTKNAAAVVLEADSPPLQKMVGDANAFAAMAANYSDERDLLNQLLGQAQMAGAFEEFSRTVRTSKLAFVKENKLYRALSGKKTPHGAESLSGTWEEFCGLLGRSVDQVDRDITNLRAFGEEALESMSRMGIGYRELRQFRRLPDDQKTALIEVAKSGDKDSFLELAEDLIAKHAKEKEALTQRAEEAEANLEARSRVLEDKNTKIDQITEQLAKAKKRVKALPPANVGEEIRKEAMVQAAQAEVGIRAMRASLQALADHTNSHDIQHCEFMAGLVCQLEMTLRQLRDEFDIKATPGGEEMPDWLRVDSANTAETQVMRPS
ncbi:hypothetical protein [Ralstonia pseudosolanacearum]|uniref:hypothetical protein n=1 Tax=Ralstonia pseudosolanacearum TaxID=1310165 RepID=UPI001B37C988|nr:hypothetical protein [Ralstonia pseudosolanacearum]